MLIILKLIVLRILTPSFSYSWPCMIFAKSGRTNLHNYHTKMDFRPPGNISLGVIRYMLTKRDICKKQIKFALRLLIAIDKMTKGTVHGVLTKSFNYIIHFLRVRVCSFRKNNYLHYFFSTQHLKLYGAGKYLSCLVDTLNSSTVYYLFKQK